MAFACWCDYCKVQYVVTREPVAVYYLTADSHETRYKNQEAFALLQDMGKRLDRLEGRVDGLKQKVNVRYGKQQKD